MEPQTHAPPGGGWWPYVVPYFAFLLVVEISSYFPAALALPALFLKPAIPAAVLLCFFLLGSYPELRLGAVLQLRTLADIIAGAASACLWVFPYLLFPSLRPGLDVSFDPEVAGPELTGLTLLLRFVGFVLVTPVFEELFIRSFVMRYAQAMTDQSDFRTIPIGSYSARGFFATVVVFTITHAPWEYWVAAPWIVLTNLYFYWRRDLRALIVLHAVANACIFLFVVYAAPAWPGLPSLWFFL